MDNKTNKLHIQDADVPVDAVQDGNTIRGRGSETGRQSERQRQGEEMAATSLGSF